MDNPESQHKIYRAVNTEMVGFTLAKIDPVRYVIAFGATLCALDHLGLYVQRYYFSIRPDDPGKRHTEITQSTAYIYRCLTGFDEIPKNIHGVVKNLPERVIETIAKPPGTGMRAEQQESPKEIYPVGLHFPNYPEQLPANAGGQGAEPAEGDRGVFKECHDKLKSVRLLLVYFTARVRGLYKPSHDL